MRAAQRSAVDRERFRFQVEIVEFVPVRCKKTTLIPLRDIVVVSVLSLCHPLSSVGA